MSTEEKAGSRVRGLKLKTITICLIAVLLALCSIFIVSIVHIRSGHDTLTLAYEECIKFRQDAQLVKEGSYFLTEEVHLFVVTGEKKYADNYFEEVNVTRRRNNAVEDLRQITVITSAQQALIEALEQSEKLKEREIYAIRLVAEAIAEESRLDPAAYLATYDPSVVDCALSQKDAALSPADKRELAGQIVFDEKYLEFRDLIDSNIQTFLDSTYDRTMATKNTTLHDMRYTLTQQSIFIVLVLLLTVIYSLCISRLVLKPLKIYMKCVREGRTFEMLGAYEFKHLALTYNNIFEVQHENERMLRQKAEHDPLTGLLNRGAYNRICAQYIERETHIAALIIDIDDFKSVNDTYGHAVGDELIRSVSELLLTSFRPSDIVARIGGDEFAIIMLDITSESAENIGIKIANLNDALQRPTSDLPRTSLSVGAAFSEYGYSDELFKRADAALYETKRGGKHGFSFHPDVIRRPDEPDDDAPSKKRKQ